MDTIKHNPARLYNCDETGITILQHKHTKLLGLKGKRQISSLHSSERGSLLTFIICMSPTGHFIPPLLVFQRKNVKQEMMNGTPPGSIHACHPSGWIESEIFSRWFLRFITHTKPTKKILLFQYWTGTIHTPGTWRSLLQLERIMLTSFTSHLTAATKCNP